MPIALVICICFLFFSTPVPGQPTTEPGPSAAQADPLAGTAAAIARAEARKTRAMARLEREAGVVDAEARAAVRAQIEVVLTERLAAVRAAFDRAKAKVEADFGYADAFDGLWQQVVSDEETRQAFLRSHVMDALEAAGYRAAIESFSAGVRDDLASLATERYRVHQERVDAILFQAVAEGDLLGSATRAAFEALQSDFRRLKMEQSIADPDIGIVEAPSAVPDKLLIGIVGKLLMKGIGRAMLTRVGTLVGGQLVAKILAAPVLGPVGLLVGAGALAWDLSEFRNEMAGAVTASIDRIYEETVTPELASSALAETLTAATAASLQQQFTTDVRLAREALDGFFHGLFEQAQSPGYAAFQEGQTPEAAFDALKKVSLVFQRGHLDLSFTRKYHLASTVPVATAREALAVNAAVFLALHEREAALLQEVTGQPHGRLFLRTTLQDEEPLDALRFFQAASGRFGTLTETQAAGLVLIRRHAPALAADSLTLPLLEIVGGHARRLDTLLAEQPGAGAALFGWLADGTFAYSLFDRILRGPAPGVHLAVLARLGPVLFADRVIQPGHADHLADFVGVHGLERTEALLQQSHVDYLAAHRSLGGGGARAVAVLERLQAAYGGTVVPPAILETLDWTLRTVPVAPERIDRRYLESLDWLGAGGTLPDVIGAPLAEAVALLGWPVRGVVLLLCLGFLLIFVLPLAKFVVRRLVRQVRPAPPAHSPPGPASQALEAPRR